MADPIATKLLYVTAGSPEEATKIATTLVEQAVTKIIELHSYDCPAVVVLNIEHGNPEFLKWIDSNTL